MRTSRRSVAWEECIELGGKGKGGLGCQASKSREQTLQGLKPGALRRIYVRAEAPTPKETAFFRQPDTAGISGNKGGTMARCGFNVADMGSSGAGPLPEAQLLRLAGLAGEFGEAGFGGGQGLFFFAEGEADLGGAVAGIVVEAGARDAGDADFFDEIFGEADIGRF